MRIGLYGLPTSGKSFLLHRVRDIEILAGSRLLKNIHSDFEALSQEEKHRVRRELALKLREKDTFLMDGHYSFGDQVVFTEEDGELYDTFLYLYVDPRILEDRMKNSPRNRKYLQFPTESWQEREIAELRQYCHVHKKDFYVLDHPREGYFSDLSPALQFIRQIVSGFSCVGYARKCAADILGRVRGDEITLTDGDRTLIWEDSSALLGYTTHVFDGNFYTGFQSWRHLGEWTRYLQSTGKIGKSLEGAGAHRNPRVLAQISEPCFILTSGWEEFWKGLGEGLGMEVYGGSQMSADTKYFIVKLLQEAGKRVRALGDSMNDYFMLKQADWSYLVLRQDGSRSGSLKNRDMEGICLV